MFATKLDCQLVPVLMFCTFSSVFPVPCLSREEGGCLSFFLFLSIFDLAQDSRESSHDFYAIVHDM